MALSLAITEALAAGSASGYITRNLLPVGGVLVSLNDEVGNNFVAAIFSDANGYYEIGSIPFGHSIISVSDESIGLNISKEVDINAIGDLISIDFQLPWSIVVTAQVSIRKYIDFYNSERKHQTLDKTPDQAYFEPLRWLKQHVLKNRIHVGDYPIFGVYCLSLGGLKPPASAGSFEHDFVSYTELKIIDEEVIRYFSYIFIWYGALNIARKYDEMILGRDCEIYVGRPARILE